MKKLLKEARDILQQRNISRYDKERLEAIVELCLDKCNMIDDGAECSGNPLSDINTIIRLTS